MLVLLLLLFIASFRIGDSSGGGRELSLLMDPDGTGVWRRLIASFNESNPEVPVRLVEGPPATNTREDMYSTAFLGGGRGYDIVYCDLIWVPKFAAAGWLLDLTDRLDSRERDEFLPADLAAGMYQGKLYRIPAFTDAGLLYYRTDLVSNPPNTFEDLFAAASDKRSDDRWGFVWQGKQFEGLITNFLEVLWGYGGEWITDDRQVWLDTPEALAALQFLVKTVGTISPPGVTTYIEEDARSVFQNGRSVFLRNWLYVWNLVERSNADIKGHVGFVPMVHADGKMGAATLGGWGFAISKRTLDPDAAWKFVKFVTASEQLRLVYEINGRIPARTALVPPEFREIMAHARVRPRIPEYAQASDILQRWVSAALSGSVSAEEALKRAAQETRLLLRTPA